MDIMGALALAGQSVKLVKDLRDLERGLDAASYKSKMADLYGNLADIKMALSDAKEALHEKEAEIKKLKDDIRALKSGETCPLCQTGKMKVIAVVDDPLFGVFGAKQHTLLCQNADCAHRETRQIDPGS
ncbi:hypothetical protein [Rhizobium sp. Nf11,1]|uniref:hypothetical protein n=1 Tax=Rhizobium sp. Nf11,1 TaxID=3404923 RepID=UPI003D358CFE